MKKSTSPRKRKPALAATPVAPAAVPNQSDQPEGDKVTLFPQQTAQTNQEQQQSTPASAPDSTTAVRSKKTEKQQHSLTPDAYALWHEDINVYTDALGRTHREQRRHYLPATAVERLAKLLDRPITTEEMDVLVGLDGEGLVTCMANSDPGKARKFQPVWWVEIIDPDGRFFTNVLKAISDEKAITKEVLERAHARVAGQFFPHPDVRILEPITISGVPFYWNANSVCSPAIWSPLWKVMLLNHGLFGKPRSAVNKVLLKREAQKQEEKKVEEGLNRLRDVFQAARAKNNTGRDRRQFFVRRA